MEVTAQEAKKQGLDVKLIEFSDWVAPNAAVDSGELDVNFFQHQAFLDQAVKQRGFKLKSVDIGVLDDHRPVLEESHEHPGYQAGSDAGNFQRCPESGALAQVP